MAPLLRPLAALLLAASLAGLAGCATSPSGGGSSSSGTPAGPLTAEACNLPAAPTTQANPRVILRTSEGDLTMELFVNEAPLTANNFLKLVRQGHYNGTTFHRVIKDFMMQGGDGPRAGKPAAAVIPDEFHRLLRMDGKGVVAMANAGPNTGSDQFFITFRETNYLNDKHAVFGKVVGGLALLDKISSEVGADADPQPPKRTVTLTGAEVVPQEAAAGPLGLAFWIPDAAHAVSDAGGDTQFLAVVENKGDRQVPVCVVPTPAAGVSARVEAGYANFQLPAKQRVAFTVEARVTAAAAAETKLLLTASTVGAATSTNLTLTRSAAVEGRLVKTGETVTGNYVGMTVDGRIFDTSVKAVGDYAKDNNLGYNGFKGRPSYSTFTFKPGGNVIQGFTDLALVTNPGGKSAGRIAPEDGYGKDCSGYPAGQCPPLAGRTLLFQLEAVSVK